MNPSEYLPNLIGYVIDTRYFGQTYVHVNVRRSAFRFDGILGEVNGRQVRLTWTGWGRSLQSGGHKYKAHANYTDTGKPVPTKLLRAIVPIAEGGDL